MSRATGRRSVGAIVLGAAVASVLLFAGAASAASWRLVSQSNPTAVPGEEIQYYVEFRTREGAIPPVVQGNDQNCVSGAPAPASPGNCITFTAVFPEGITPIGMSERRFLSEDCETDLASNSITCSVSGSTSSQQANEGGGPRGLVLASVDSTAEGTLSPVFEVSGGGGGPASIADATRIVSGLPEFGISAFDGQVVANAQDEPFTQAGGVPYAITNDIELNSYRNLDLPNPAEAAGLENFWPVEPVKDIEVDVPPGLVANTTAAGRCTAGQLGAVPGISARTNDSFCPASSQVGTVRLRLGASNALFGPVTESLAVFNMVPPSGRPARFGFKLLSTVVLVDAELRSDTDYGITLASRNTIATLGVQGSNFEFWGVPFDEAHLADRDCPGVEGARKSCSANATPVAFLRQPTSCPPAGKGIDWTARTNSWFDPGDVEVARFESHDPPGFPAAPSDWGPPQGTTGCDAVPIKAKFTGQPTALDTETSTGLQVRLEVPNPGLENPTGIASSDLKKVRVTLPQGMTINPSQAEGLGVCSRARYESTELSFHPTPGRGCPDDSKIGSVSVKSPLLDETIPGDVFIAQQDDPSTRQPGAENPFDSLLALYVVLREPERGILVKLPGKVETDAATGRIVTTFDDLPQLPFETFDFKFREGARAPLVTPPTCGTHTSEAEIWGHSDPDGPPLISKSSFQIVSGIGGGPCPPGGIPGFDPGFSAGTIDNDAGSFSPTTMRLTRLDGEQDLTRFSAKLAPGLLAKLAGMGKCSDAQIAAATAPGHTGRRELASPSCPAASKIGRTLAGAGVGSVLTYVPGSLYLAGPYRGAPLSVVAITPAVAGPFDVGTVVVREALDLDPVTGVASVDGAASDPIPHILEGIPLKLRDLRVYVDRDQFTLNPTDCDRSQIGATLWGSAGDVFNPADDAPVSRSSRFQAANCASLGFRPKLKVLLRGGTKRGGFPGLRAVLTPRKGDANLGRVAVVLPRSAFLEQGHIRTICTRVQFDAGAGNGAGCPAGSVYGHVRAWTPLLDEPLKGPVYLRSSNHKLPDLVLALHGLVDIEAAGRIDSVPLGGGAFGIRSIFESVPDAPLSRVVLDMQGGGKGLIVNSRSLCLKPTGNRMRSNLDGHNGKRLSSRPVVEATRCRKRRGARRVTHRSTFSAAARSSVGR